MYASMLQPAKIGIVDFKITKRQISNPFHFNSRKVEGITFNVDFELGFNLQGKLVRLIFRSILKPKSKKKILLKLLAHSVLSMFFI